MKLSVQAAGLDVEAMLAACLPGGEVCDPQQVADSIRGYLASRAPAQADEAAFTNIANFIQGAEISAPLKQRWLAALAHRATAQAPEQPVNLTEPSVERPEAADVQHEGDAP